MDNRAKKFILTGIIVSLIGSVIAVSAVYVTGWVEASIDRNLVSGVWFAKVIISMVQFGIAPFGAALTAIGFALHWMGNGTSPERTASTLQHEADLGRDVD
ncbi:hypothetical protein QEH68_01740 [Paenarthrobacter sp. OM7]|uniref:Uncharacterized protein n=1 Tax=Paenarthrobacter sp. AMU7 TaxID=3162492 RepID=A0AB39YNM5_9MICC|nr:hypothetical protein [Paenarthrobacter sp. OM7]WGM20938.1 hypothetical protein QEH68_01740 [Paenarthrobacter sp. OM7]